MADRAFAQSHGKQYKNQNRACVNKFCKGCWLILGKISLKMTVPLVKLILICASISVLVSRDGATSIECSKGFKCDNENLCVVADTTGIFPYQRSPTKPNAPMPVSINAHWYLLDGDREKIAINVSWEQNYNDLVHVSEYYLEIFDPLRSFGIPSYTMNVSGVQERFKDDAKKTDRVTFVFDEHGTEKYRTLKPGREYSVYVRSLPLFYTERGEWAKTTSVLIPDCVPNCPTTAMSTSTYQRSNTQARLALYILIGISFLALSSTITLMFLNKCLSKKPRSIPTIAFVSPVIDSFDQEKNRIINLIIERSDHTKNAKILCNWNEKEVISKINLYNWILINVRRSNVVVLLCHDVTHPLAVNIAEYIRYHIYYQNLVVACFDDCGPKCLAHSCGTKIKAFKVPDKSDKLAKYISDKGRNCKCSGQLFTTGSNIQKTAKKQDVAINEESCLFLAPNFNGDPDVKLKHSKT